MATVSHCTKIGFVRLVDWELLEGTAMRGVSVFNIFVYKAERALKQCSGGRFRGEKSCLTGWLMRSYWKKRGLREQFAISVTVYKIVGLQG